MQLYDNIHWKFILIGACILCFNAGYINSLTLNTNYQISSAHVTGLVAKLSIATYLHDWNNLKNLIITYITFIFGAIISGLIIDYEIFHLGAKYGIMLILIGIVQSFGIILEENCKNSIYFIWTCSLSCGMQNGLTSKYSNNIIRTTHLTGTTTDFGVTIGHIIKGRINEIDKLVLQLISIICFFCGGIFGTLAFYKYNHYALFFSSITSLIVGITFFTYKKVKKINENSLFIN
jgi:uncharacterized membrane protein YoaK (UPF0700 family)